MSELWAFGWRYLIVAGLIVLVATRPQEPLWTWPIGLALAFAAWFAARHFFVVR